MTLGDNNFSKRKAAVAATFVLAFVACGPVVGCGGDDTTEPVVVVEDTGGTTTDTGAPDTTPPDTTPPDTGSEMDTNVDTKPPPTVPTATPVFAPAPGTFATAQSVTITSSTPGAVVYYTTDGTTPNVSSPKYSAPINVAATVTIKAMALAPDFLPSEVVTGVYTINIPAGTVAPVTFTPPAGTYDNDQSVGLASTTPAATICYTLDGTAPTCDEPTGKCSGSSATYSGSSPVTINTTGRKIRALACKVGMTNSAPSEAAYTLNAADAVFTPPAGPYTSAITLTASLATAGGVVRYTTDGTTPNCTTIGTPFVSGTLTLSTNTVLKAITCKAGYNPSAVKDHSYQFANAAPVITPAAGDRNNETTVTMTAAGTGAIICYSIDPTKTPVCNTKAVPDCTDSTKYTAALTVDKNTTVRAVACSPATNQSTMTTAAYNMVVAAPVITPATGTTFTSVPALINISTTTVNTSATKQVQIYWTIDAAPPNCTTPPTAASQTCGAGMSSCTINKSALNAAGGSTINAIACKTDYAPGSASVNYPAAGTLGSPSVAPNGGTFNNDQPITLTHGGPVDATVCYTISTSATAPDPDCDAAGACTVGTAYNATMKPTTKNSGEIVKARVCKAGSTKSAVVTSAAFTFVVADPITFTPPGGNYGWGTEVKFTNPTSGVTFHRTTGISPTYPTCATGTTGDTYTVNTTFAEIVYVIACKPGYNPSTVYGDVYYSTYLGAPVFTPAPTPAPDGDITNVPTVKMTSVSKAVPNFKICYTTDNSTPTCGPTKVCGCTGGPAGGCVVTTGADGATATLPTSGTRLNALVCGDGYSNSAVTSSAYTFRSSRPLFTPDSVAWAAGAAYTTGKIVQHNTRTWKALKDNLGVTPGLDATTWEEQTSLTVTLGLDPNDTLGGKTVGSKLCWRLNATPAFDATPGVAACTPAAGTTCNDGGAGVPADKTFTLTSSTTINAVSCKAGFTQSTAFATYSIAPKWHTIDMSSAVNDFTAAEAFTSTTMGATGYMTWDANYIYLGFQGAGFAGSSYFHVYLNGQPAGDTTVTATAEYGTTALPFGDANWHLRVKADDVFNVDTGIKNWNGSGWANPAAPPTMAVQRGGSGATAFTKVRIARSELGLSASTAVVKAVGGIWDGSANTAVFPSGPAWTKWIEAPLSDSLNQNDASHIKP